MPTTRLSPVPVRLFRGNHDLVPVGLVAHDQAGPAGLPPVEVVAVRLGYLRKIDLGLEPLKLLVQSSPSPAFSFQLLSPRRMR